MLHYLLEGTWNIANPESIKTSFPNFLKIINELKNNEKTNDILKITIDSPAAAGAGTQAKLIGKHL